MGIGLQQTLYVAASPVEMTAQSLKSGKFFIKYCNDGVSLLTECCGHWSVVKEALIEESNEIFTFFNSQVTGAVTHYLGQFVTSPTTLGMAPQDVQISRSVQVMQTMDSRLYV